MNAWEDDPRYPVADWKYEVENGDTRLGYRDWLEHKQEMDREDHEPRGSAQFLEEAQEDQEVDAGWRRSLDGNALRGALQEEHFTSRTSRGDLWTGERPGVIWRLKPDLHVRHLKRGSTYRVSGLCEVPEVLEDGAKGCVHMVLFMWKYPRLLPFPKKSDREFVYWLSDVLFQTSTKSPGGPLGEPGVIYWTTNDRGDVMRFVRPLSEFTEDRFEIIPRP